MTQFVVTIENGADKSFLRRAIENMKGIINVSEQPPQSVASHGKSKWLEQLESMRNMMDPSLIDMTDERTRYIMSK